MSGLLSRFVPLFAALIPWFILLPHAQSGERIASEAPRWCKWAIESLEQSSGAPFICSSKTPRCIKMNNYSCTKNSSARPYPGQVTTAKGLPVTDIDHHALYEEPKWSLLKTIAILKWYYNQRELHSAIQIAETWAPWCDTNGSKLVHLGWGRTCTDGPGPAPSTFTGPRCRKPTGTPQRGQCGPCNCPNELAAFYVKGVGKTTRDDLHLFDAKGRSTPALKPVLKQVVQMELGYRPREKLVDGAISIYKDRR